MYQQNQQQSLNQEHNIALDVANQIGEKKPPTNQQISEIIDKTHQYIEEKKYEPAVSQQSVKVLSDFQGVLEATEQFNKNKNPDEALQKVILETGAAGKEIKNAGQEAWNKSDKESLQQKGQQAQQQGKQLTQAIWSVLKEMVRSADFRVQMASLMNVFQDLLYRGASQAPSQQIPASTGLQQGEFSTQTTAKLSEENKREIAHQFLQVLRRLNQNPDFRTGFHQLIDLFQSLANEQSYNTSGFSKDYAPIPGEPQQQIPQQVVQTVQQSEHVDAAYEESKKLVERFSKRSIDTLIQKNRSLFEYVRNHDEIRKWWDNVSNFLKQALENPHQLDDYEASKKAESLINEGDSLANDPELTNRYRQVQDEVKAIMDSIRDDPDLKLLQERSQAFMENFTSVGEDGQRKFNTDLVKELQSFIIPLLVAQLDKIPLPPVSGSNEDYDYFFDNMILFGQEIIPDKVKIHAQSDAEFNIRQLEAKEARNQLYLEISNIQAKVENIHFKLNRKTFPAVSDEGYANLRVEGNQGFSLKLNLVVDTNDQGIPRFNLKKVDANIQSLKIDIIEAHHQVLLKFFAMIYQAKMKLMIQDGVEEKIREVFDKLETGINNVFSRFPPSKLKEVVSQKANDALYNANQQKTTKEQSAQSDQLPQKSYLA